MRILRKGENIPISGLRGQRQRGGLLKVRVGNKIRDLSPCVIKKVFVPADLSQEATELNQDYLFPPADVDSFHGMLLREKYAENSSLSDLCRWIVESALPRS